MLKHVIFIGGNPANDETPKKRGTSCFRISSKYANFAHMIDHHTIDKIRAAADIYEVVREFVTLKKAGVNFKGLCPFHDERTPSFVVSPSKGLFKCFSCGEGGDAIGFIMKHEQMSYTDALRWLAKRYGIHIEEREMSDADKQMASDREAMLTLNEWALGYFQQTLQESVDGIAIGMAYFRGRGFRDDIIRKFQLGYCPAQRDAMTTEALKRGYKKDFLLKTGLTYETEQKALVDRYHGRVIFPIHTVGGRVVAFGGRILGNDAKQQHVGKYVNSPESEIYSKSNELYGLFQAKHAITKKGKCYLVEGYTDVISMHQAGIENVVASSGTALTKGQIRLIRRFSPNVTVLYDGDAAGIKASLRGIDMLLAEGMNVAVLLLPDGEDPDSFARGRSATDFEAYIKQHETDFIRFKTQLLMSDSSDDPRQQAAAIKDIVESIAAIPDLIARQTYIHRCAQQVGMDERIIAAEVERALATGRRDAKYTDAEEPSAPTENAESKSDAGLIASRNVDTASEQMLLKLIVRHGSLPLYTEQNDDGEVQQVWTVAGYIAADLAQDEIELSHPLHRQILAEAAALPATESHPYATLHHFLASTQPDVQQLAATLAEDDYELSKNHRKMHKPDEEKLLELVPRVLNEYKFHIIESSLKQLLQQLQTPEVKSNPALAVQIMQQFAELNKLKQQLAPLIGERIVTV